VPRVALQSFRNCKISHADVAAPLPGPREVVVRTASSLISAGTERMLVDFGRSNLLQKARKQPQRVGEVAAKARAEGLLATAEAVRTKLDSPTTLGYSSAGRVVAVGREVDELAVGQLVATTAPHGELATVPVTFAALVPDGVPAEQACFASVAAVAFQGVRLAAPSAGERFVVTGLGLVGLLAVQALLASGCDVLGVDFDESRLAMARRFGATAVGARSDVVAAATSWTRGQGVDGVLVCASTESSEPVHQAAQMCRRRGRIVLVGVAGLELDRSDFYAKELSFQVSSSLGPGRYDVNYEAGVDYPFGDVRWTAGRNMAAVLGLMASGRMSVDALISHRFDFERADEAYRTLLDDPSALGIVLQYPGADVVTDERLLQRAVAHAPARPTPSGAAAVVGAGNFADRVLVPAFVATGVPLEVVVSRQGVSASVLAGRHGAARSTTDLDAVLNDPDIEIVVIATRHDSHAALVARALRSGKHVFVEKPLAIDDAGIDGVVAAYEEVAAAGSAPQLAIGFNRRFAPITQRMRKLLDDVQGPKALILTMNAGRLPTSHWLRNRDVGGGRIVGEACHHIDLARHLVGCAIRDVDTHLLGDDEPDSACVTLGFEDGSVATINYLANGSARYPKERVEVHAGGRTLVNDNFRALKAYGWRGRHSMRSVRQDKGHSAGVAAFVDAVRRGGPPPIPLTEILEVSRAAVRAAGR
jgi:predicted dehydrogenase/threonine dehydrogenase-like Zn-dependent dehydrogenase